MTKPQHDGHYRVVVDGSNIATEGRSSPSLAQLNDAVLGFSDEHPEAMITVVVDATFGHRIDKSEVREFDEAVAHNELVAPPAGAIGRGDAFVLSIANKVGATILSNDSFQEFHGEYPWLFDEGRLIGGKPVPNIGWVFVDRVPVKGPISRRARAGVAAATRRQASKMASEPMPVPTKPPPRAARSERDQQAAAPAEPATVAVAVAEAAVVDAAPKPARNRGGAGVPVNDLIPFIDFVEHHPVGSSVTGVVESYSSHGAYVTIGELRGYVPLRLMASPPPRSARDVLKLGEAATLVVVSFAPARRSVDLAMPDVAATPSIVESVVESVADAVDEIAAEVPAAAASTPTRRRPRKQVASDSAPAVVEAPEPGSPEADAAPAPARKRVSKRATAKAAAPAASAPESPADPTPTRRRSKKATADPPEKQAAVRKTAAKKAPVRAAARNTPASTVTEAAASEAAPAKRPAKPAAKKSAGKDTAAAKETPRPRRSSSASKRTGKPEGAG